MNNFQVSWINNEGLELYSGWTDYVSAINLFREICKEKVDTNFFDSSCDVMCSMIKLIY